MYAWQRSKAERQQCIFGAIHMQVEVELVNENKLPKRKIIN